MKSAFRPLSLVLALTWGLSVLGCRSAHTRDDLMEAKTVSGLCPVCGNKVEATKILDEGSFDGYGEDGKWTFGTRFCKTCSQCKADLMSKLIGNGRYPDRIKWKVIGTNHKAYVQSQQLMK